MNRAFNVNEFRAWRGMQQVTRRSVPPATPVCLSTRTIDSYHSKAHLATITCGDTEVGLPYCNECTSKRDWMLIYMRSWKLWLPMAYHAATASRYGDIIRMLHQKQAALFYIKHQLILGKRNVAATCLEAEQMLCNYFLKYIPLTPLTKDTSQVLKTHKTWQTGNQPGYIIHCRPYL